MIDEDKLRALRKKVLDQFVLNSNSDHGVAHWERVESVGLHLAKQAGADTEIIRLFALLVLDQPRLELLMFACKYHNDRAVHSKNVTVNICWDSDRIDLTRVGLLPSEIQLTTQAGKEYIATSNPRTTI